MMKSMYKTNPIGDGRTCDLVKAFCKTKPISGKPMLGTPIAKRTQFLPEDLAKKAVITCHSGVAVLCALCVSAVELPFCKTKPIFVGRRCWESSYLYHPGMAVLCVLCVSAVKVPFCKTKPISGKPMTGSRIAKRSQF
jgi:hypothetical protein